MSLGSTVPKYVNPSNNLKYFDPRFVRVRRGSTIEWINDDTRAHTLISHKFGELTDLLRLGPGESLSTTIDHVTSRIDYLCSAHPEERGTIIVEANEDEMSNSKNLELLSNIFNIKPPKIIGHLDSPKRKAMEQALQGIQNPKSLVKYFDPLTLEMLLNPAKYQLQNKCLTVAFWDLYGFSDLSNQLNSDPSTLVQLLKNVLMKPIGLFMKNMESWTSSL